MSPEYYLTRLESNCSLNHIERTPPPEISNFYWKNDAEEKFKAFIPTPNRYVYYNLEEYVGDIEIDQIEVSGWTLAKKCVLLALTYTYPEDRRFINHMEHLIANLSAWKQINNNHLVDVGRYVEYINKNLNRHYILTKYLVKNIRNVRMELRGTCATFRDKITIHPDHDAANAIHWMTVGFKLAAERFINDQNYGVYAYSRISYDYNN